MSKPLVLVTGCLGQLGSAIQQHWDASQVAARYELLPVDIYQLDLTDTDDLIAYLSQLHPAIIINAAAFTQVDEAETNREAAYAINAEAVLSLAKWCRVSGCKLIQISTDFVFDGAATAPYTTYAQTNPLSVYGASKLAGENHVLDLLPRTGYVVRTSWLYSEYGSNFVKTMLRLMRQRPELKVVNDQIGSPTSVHTLAHYLFELIHTGTKPGVYHWCDGGEISWFHFAQEIYQQGRDQGLLEEEVALQPIAGADYPTPATRPAYSVLDRGTSLTIMGGAAETWQASLKLVMINLSRVARKPQGYRHE
jgi:dTDP-4-dehydrorhamnose reductase